MMPDPLADLRLSDTERTQALDALSAQYVEGRLDLAEFDERSSLLTAAKTFGELAPAFQGLPGGAPFDLGPDGRPVLRGGAVMEPGGLAEIARAESDLVEVKKKGGAVERIDSIGLAVALVAFFGLMVAGFSYFWVVWPIYGVAAIISRVVVGLNDDEEEAYEQLKKAESADRAERLKVAMQRRRELDGREAR